MKIKVLAIAWQSIFIVLFNLFFFLLIEKLSATRWVCFGAIHLSYLVFLMAANSIPKQKSGVAHGYPKIVGAVAYFLTVMFLGVLFIIINTDSTLVPTLAMSLVTAVFLIYHTSLMFAEENSIDNDNKDTQNLYFTRNMSSHLRAAMEAAPSSIIKKEVEKAYDAIHNAQGFSSPLTKDIEERIQEMVGILDGMVRNNESLHIIQEFTSNLIREIKRRDESLKMSYHKQ